MSIVQRQQFLQNMIDYRQQQVSDVTVELKKVLDRHLPGANTSTKSYNAVSEFLIIWSLMENRVFDGFFTNDKRKDIASQIADTIMPEIDEPIEGFHQRYQDRTLYKNLYHKKPDNTISLVLKKQYAELSPIEKMDFGLYVVYRYRNNIFHGNKGFASWCRFDRQIATCRTIMIALVDAWITEETCCELE